MESRIKLLGHPIHPMLVVYPLGLFSTAVIFDVLYWITGNRDLSTFVFWALGAGLVGALGAAVVGAVDWIAIPKGTRARRIGALHGGGNVVVTALFGLSFLMRTGGSAYLPSLLPLLLTVVGGAVALFTAWLGGELVYRLRVAVDDDAGLDASSSLSRETVVDIKV